MRLSDRIRAARRMKGWSQSELAAELKVDRSAVGHWERGDGSAPSATRLFALARVTGVYVEWLANGSGPMLVTPLPEGSDKAPRALSNEEEHLLSCFARISGRARLLLLELAETQASAPEQRPRGLIGA